MELHFLQCWLSRAVEDKHLADRGTTAAINRGGGNEKAEVTDARKTFGKDMLQKRRRNSS